MRVSIATTLVKTGRSDMGVVRANRLIVHGESADICSERYLQRIEFYVQDIDFDHIILGTSHRTMMSLTGLSGTV